MSVAIIGRLGQDPRMWDTSNGGSLAQFSVATTVPRYRTVSKDPASETDTCWVACVALGDVADYVEAHCHKGSTVKVEGYLQESHYTDANGVLHRGHQLRAVFVTAQNGGGAATAIPRQATAPAAPVPTATPRTAPKPRQAAAPAAPEIPEPPEFDDPIPF